MEKVDLSMSIFFSSFLLKWEQSTSPRIADLLFGKSSVDSWKKRSVEKTTFWIHHIDYSSCEIELFTEVGNAIDLLYANSPPYPLGGVGAGENRRGRMCLTVISSPLSCRLGYRCRWAASRSLCRGPCLGGRRCGSCRRCPSG